MNKAWIICICVTVAGIAVAIGLIVGSLRRLSTEEAGIKYDTIRRILYDKLFVAGLHAGPVGYEFIIFPKNYRSLAFDDVTCMNKDGLEIQLDVQFQYLAKLSGETLKKLIMEYETHENFAKVVMLAAEEVIHETCSRFNVTQFQSELVHFQNSIHYSLDKRLGDEFYTGVRDVQVSDIKRPHEYETVVREKESAKQNIKIARQERPRVLTAAKTKLLEAETQSNITLNVAHTNARIAVKRAETEAKAIMKAYETEAETYKSIMDNQGLSIDGVLSYLTTRAIEESRNPVNVNLKAPA